MKTKEISRSDALTRAETITGTPAPPAEPSTGASDRVLVVDLDGTLLRSDMLHETLWNALTRDPRAGLRALGALRRGRAALKDALAQDTTVRVETLPFDPRVIARIEARRAAGGRIALVTATDQRLAEAVAAHLGLFDEVHGSAEGVNLKGAEKARFLADRYGRSGFDYIGDSSADLPVWEAAERAISVGASAAVRRQLDARAGARPEHLPPAQAQAAAILRALRPHQWLKNVLVFVPMVADLAFDPRSFLMSLLAFVALSFAASAGYVVNDLLDLSDDRSHPRKRNRPFASGAVSAQVGTALIPLLLLGGAMAALAVGPVLLGVVALYFVATLSYSVKLKQHTMVDICMLATLYTIRIIAGGVAIGVVLSVWLLAVSMFMFFSLAAVKRLAELTDLEAAGREVSRRGYRVEDRAVLSQMAIASGYLSVLVLALYIDEPLVQEKFGAPWLLWGVCPLLIFWISRMVMIAARGEMHDDPMIWALENRTSRKVMLGTAIFIALAVVA